MNDSTTRLFARAGIEVLVVVVGILIAFGLDSWWDARQEAVWEHAELTALRGEFTATVEHVGQVVASHERTAAQVRTILDFASNNAPGALAVFPDTLLTQLITWRTSEISSGTLDALLASDDLGRLSNADLRRDLTAWKAWVLDAQEKETLARDFIEYVLTPALVGDDILSAAWMARPPWGTGQQPNPVEIQASAKLTDLASARLGHVRLAIFSQTRVRDEALGILALLDEELGDGQASITNRQEEDDMKRVTGLGGLFFRSQDPNATLAWYREHLGIESEAWGGLAFQWLDKQNPEETGYTVWSAFPDDTKYFEPSQQSFMMNFRVHDLEGLIAALRSEGVEVVGEIQQHENGKFAWILDPEGRKLELWEPVPSKDDPYLG